MILSFFGFRERALIAEAVTIQQALVSQGLPAKLAPPFLSKANLPTMANNLELTRAARKTKDSHNT
jgi:hypothetical protein